MKDFVFYSPTCVVFGKHAISQIGELIAKKEYRHILIHYGGGSVIRNGILKAVTDELDTSGIRYSLLGGVSANPKIDLVREGVKLCKEQPIDFILAVGGGSVIDSAKGIAIGALMEQDVWTVFTRESQPEIALPIGSVLTIAAAGSELSNGLVLTNPEGGLKRDFGHECLRPQFAILNPTFTFSVNQFQTACGIVDILMHTLERYFTPTPDVDLIDEMSEGLLRAVIQAGKKVMENLEDYEARATLMWASSLSHNGLTGTGRAPDWATHQLEHDVSGMYDHVAHGAGLAVIFPAWCHYVMHTDPARFCRYAQNVWGIDGNGLSQEAWAQKGIEATQEYFVSLGMPKALKELGVEETRLPEMAEKCSFGGQRTIGNFQKIHKEDMLAIYRLAF